MSCWLHAGRALATSSGTIKRQGEAPRGVTEYRVHLDKLIGGCFIDRVQALVGARIRSKPRTRGKRDFSSTHSGVGHFWLIGLSVESG